MDENLACANLFLGLKDFFHQMKKVLLFRHQVFLPELYLIVMNCANILVTMMRQPQLLSETLQRNDKQKKDGYPKASKGVEAIQDFFTSY